MKHSKKLPRTKCVFHKRGGDSGGGGGGENRRYGGYQPQSENDWRGDAKNDSAGGLEDSYFDSLKRVTDTMDVYDVYDDIATIAPDMKATEANSLIRQALNLEVNAKIPDELTGNQAVSVIRLIAQKQKFNLRKSELKYYLNY